MTRTTNRRAGDAAARKERQSGRIDPAEHSHVAAASQARRTLGCAGLWRADTSSLCVYCGLRRQAAVCVVPVTRLGMFRGRLPYGRVSDKPNMGKQSGPEKPSA